MSHGNPDYTAAVTGLVVVSGPVTVTGTVTVTGAVSILGTVTVTGTVAISGTVTVTGTVAISGTVTVTGTVAISGTVTVTGAVTVTGTVAISGTVTITGAVTISGSVTITGAVTITSGTISVDACDITAQSVAIKTQGEWSPQAGQQKYFRVSGSSVAVGGSAAANYTVTASKTLYITHFGGSMYGTAVADRDKDQICYLNIMNNTTTTILAELGGHGGGGMVLPTPVKIPAGEVFRYQIWNFSNHVCEVYLTAGGYEI